MKKYTKEHEWVSLDGNLATIGISEYAAGELGDITFVEIPAVDDETVKGEVLTVVESVKAATDVFSPVDGKIVETNEQLEDNPQIVNDSPEEDGWICKVEVADNSFMDTLMNEDEYNSFIKSL
jgi:glycine cleavage system H protein